MVKSKQFQMFDFGSVQDNILHYNQVQEVFFLTISKV